MIPMPNEKNASISSPKMLGLLLWSLLPSASIWVGMYMIKSAMWAYILYHGIFLLPAIIIGRDYWLPSCKKPKFKHIILICAAAFIFSALTVAAYELFGQWVLRDSHVAELLREQGMTPGNLILFGLYATIVNPLVEEIYWRGIVFNALDRLPYKHFAIIWSSITYALFHYLIFRLVLFPVCAEIGIVMLALYGGILAVIYRRTGSIFTTAIAHGLWTDLACIALLIDFYRRMPMN
jgi:membrane protease YdiL (CAAX protease family)